MIRLDGITKIMYCGYPLGQLFYASTNAVSLRNEKPILYFSTSVELKEFLKITGISQPDLNPESDTLIGQFTDAELELALKGFGASTNSLEADQRNK